MEGVLITTNPTAMWKKKKKSYQSIDRFLEEHSYQKDINLIWTALASLGVVIGLIIAYLVALFIITEPLRGLELSSKSFNEQTGTKVAPKKEEPLESQNEPVIEKEEEEYDVMYNATVYAYNSMESQTDSSPHITASGYTLYANAKHRVVANNCLAFGTRVAINGIVYSVQDRMNNRYGCDVFDIWMPTYEDAIQWGKQIRDIKIYK